VLAPGWECAAAVADGAGSRVFCGRVEAMPAGAVEKLQVNVQALRLEPIQQLGVDAEVATRSVDTAAANDADGAKVQVVGQPRWGHGG
jgi:hypothetical protein